MTEFSFPFNPAVPNVPDAHSISTSKRWGQMARHWGGSGVHRGDRNELAVRPSTTALEVVVDTGSAGVLGHHYDNTAPLTKTVPAADPTLDRYDRCVAELTYTGDTGTVIAKVVPGVPGAGVLPALVQTEDIYQVALGEWVTKKGAGLIAATTSDPGRFARADIGLLSGLQLPGPDPKRQVGQKYLLLPTGAVGVNAGGQMNGSFEYVWDGTDWCIAPGQLLVQKPYFADGGGRPYGGIYGIGDARVNDGGASAQVSWTRPKCLPGHGFRYKAHALVYTAGNTVGDLIRMGLYGIAPLVGVAGPTVQAQAGGQFGSNYNPSLDLDFFALGTDNGFGSPRFAQFIVWGFLPTGIAQFNAGFAEVYSA